MLSTLEQQEIDEERRHYPQAQAVLPEALKIVQRYRGGWVSDEGVADIAAHLGLTPAEVDAVATFYTQIYRKPVGRHVILLCDSVSCWVMGYEHLLSHVTARLGITQGQTTGDGRFTLLPANCLGACDKAPAMMVDDDLHTNLTPEMLDEILERYA